MKRLMPLIDAWKGDFDAKTFLSAGLSLAVTTTFALYNGLLGLMHHSPWHESICIYYLGLSALRFAIIYVEHREHESPGPQGEDVVARTFRATSLALIALNVTLFPPVSLMVEMRKPVSMGLIPAIAMALYTVFRVTYACLNYRRRTRSSNLLTRELRAINLMDALLAILSLQNALVAVKDGVATGRILVLMALTSAALLVAMFGISVHNYRAGMRAARRQGRPS